MVKSVLLYVLMGAAALDAGTVVAPEIFVPNGTLIPGVSLSANNVTLSNGYFLNQTNACFDPYCVSVAVGNISSSFTVSDPLTVRVTNTTITCNNTGTPCGLGSAAWGFLFSLPVGVTDSLSFTLDGTAPANFAGLGARGIQSGASTPFSPITVDGSGNFSQSFDLGTSPISTYKAVLELQITGLGAGQSINLPNSMTMVFNSTPEPATLTVAGLGLLALGALAMRRRKA